MSRYILTFLTKVKFITVLKFYQVDYFKTLGNCSWHHIRNSLLARLRIFLTLVSSKFALWLAVPLFLVKRTCRIFVWRCPLWPEIDKSMHHFSQDEAEQLSLSTRLLNIWTKIVSHDLHPISGLVRRSCIVSFPDPALSRG